MKCFCVEVRRRDYVVAICLIAAKNLVYSSREILILPNSLIKIVAEKVLNLNDRQQAA